MLLWDAEFQPWDKDSYPGLKFVSPRQSPLNHESGIYFLVYEQLFFIL